MKKLTLTILILVITTICYGQTSETKYFNSEWLEEEVSENKAKFSQTVTKNPYGTVTTEVKNLKKNIIVLSETFKGKEPYGIWKFRYDNSIKTIDYNFPLIYTDEGCNDSLKIKMYNEYFKDNDSLGYKAPKISTRERDIYEYIYKNLHYPERALENGTQGTVDLQLTLTKEGTIENIVVRHGADILLDKEAVRVLRELKFSSPPTVNGQSCNICLRLPINFKLQD
jgi:TonB family protein